MVIIAKEILWILIKIQTIFIASKVLIIIWWLLVSIKIEFNKEREVITKTDKFTCSLYEHFNNCINWCSYCGPLDCKQIINTVIILSSDQTKSHSTSIAVNQTNNLICGIVLFGEVTLAHASMDQMASWMIHESKSINLTQSLVPFDYTKKNDVYPSMLNPKKTTHSGNQYFGCSLFPFSQCLIKTDHWNYFHS